MNKKIQKTLSVSNKIDGSSLYLIDEDLYGIKIPISLNDKDFFGLSYKSRISSECFKHSIDETNFNNMLSNGVKVMAIIDYDWTKEVVFNSFVKRKNGYFEVNENKGSCVGKTYLIEGEEKIINNFSKKINDSKSVSKTGSMTGINPCTIGIFGLFDLKEVGLSIVPLKYFQFFENENDAFNYIWFKERKLT